MDKNETGFEESGEQIKVAEREKGNRDKRQKERNRGGTGNDDNSSGIQPESSGTRSNGKPQRLPCPFPPLLVDRQTAGFMLELKGFVLYRCSFENNNNTNKH